MWLHAAAFWENFRVQDGIDGDNEKGFQDHKQAKMVKEDLQ